MDLTPPGWHHEHVLRPRAWLVLLAFVLALGVDFSNVPHADAQAFKARSKTGLPKRGPITAVAAASGPATPVAAAKGPAPAPRKVTTPARPVAAKKATGKKGKGGDEDDVVVVDDDDDDE